jgi:hypothetical protein
VTTSLAFSDYVVYVDESGDHGLDNMDLAYPMFVLAFCIFRKTEYVQQVVPVLQQIVELAPFTVVAAVIDKAKLKSQYARPDNPYHLAVGFCLERLKYFLSDAKVPPGRVYVVFESRGHREDAELELEFRRVCASNFSGSQFPFEPVFAGKGSNSTGLQLADLIARPIGRHVLRPEQPNRAYDIIEKKLRRSSSGTVEGYGLKCFP